MTFAPLVFAPPHGCGNGTRDISVNRLIVHIHRYRIDAKGLLSVPAATPCPSSAPC